MLCIHAKNVGIAIRKLFGMTFFLVYRVYRVYQQFKKLGYRVGSSDHKM